MKENLKNIFYFSDAIFADHDTYFKFHNVVSSKIGERGASVIHVGYKWTNTYYHFLTEALPAILSIQSNERRIHQPIACLKSSFCIPISRWFGIENDIIHELPKYTKEIVTLEFVECGNPSPQKIQLLRFVIEQKLSFEKKIGILIYRRENNRKVLNHDELLQMLKKKYSDVEWVVFDLLPIEETTILFSKARMIVGPHGAGFTNMIFAPKGIDIIEFMDTDNPNICYWHLSEMLGNKYHMIECKTINSNFAIPQTCELPFF
jgi:capsular polysaccharide biosynthesis protein